MVRRRLGQGLVSCTVEGQPNPAYPGNKNLWRFDYDTNINGSGQCGLVNISAGTGPQPTPCIPAECGGGGGMPVTPPAQPPAPGAGIPAAPLQPGFGVTPATPGQASGGGTPSSGSVIIPPGFDEEGEFVLPMPAPITPMPVSKPVQPGAQVPLVPPPEPTYDGGYEDIGSLEAEIPPPTSPGGGTGSGNPANVEKTISQWPEVPQEVCRQFIQKYGYPTECCESACVWYETAGCSRCACVRDGTAHYWPDVHKDCLCMTINYKVDPKYYGDIANFNGSVVLSRTKGTMTACCDYEAMNFLALNLARDIAEGEMTWQDARTMYVEAAKMFKEGKMHPYTQGIMFPMAQEYTGDPGVPVF